MTGMRVSGAIELRWDDVDFGAKRLRVRRRFYRGVIGEPKSRYGKREVPLSTAMAQRLWQAQGASDELLFTGPRGERVDRDWLRRNVLKPVAGVRGWASIRCAIPAPASCSPTARARRSCKSGSGTPTPASRCGPTPPARRQAGRRGLHGQGNVGRIGRRPHLSARGCLRPARQQDGAPRASHDLTPGRPVCGTGWE
jgi:integrase